MVNPARTATGRAPEAEPRRTRRPLSGGAPTAPRTLYVLDEPTIGLHMADVEKLVRVLHRLVDAGNTVVIIEHNLDIIAEADWIIDLVPRGGTAGAASPRAVHPSRWRRNATARTRRAFWPGSCGSGARMRRPVPRRAARRRAQGLPSGCVSTPSFKSPS